MSLRGRLLVGTAVIAVMLLAAALFITRSTRDDLLARVDDQLATARVQGGGFRVGPDDQQALSTYYVGFVEEEGRVSTYQKPNTSGEDAPLPEVPTSLTTGDRAGPVTVQTEGSSDLRYRLVSRPEVVLVRGQGPTRVDVVYGLPLDDVDASVQRLVRVELVVTTVILAILGLVVFWVIRLGVRPVKRMTAAAATIAGGDLSHRVPTAAPGTEAGELGTALNQMLGRIEEAFDERTRSEGRLRQFVADASHELRTPVTTIRGYAELYRSGGLDDPDELGQAMRRTEQEAVRMGTLIEDLLLLARLDQGRPLERAPVDLGVLAVDAAGDARAVDPGRPVTASVEEDVTVLGDEGRLRQVAANLVGNALVHTPPGTPVHLSVARQGDRAVLEVADRGPGMDGEVAARAFERFFRADPSRSRHRGGSGLGLAIVQATVAAHGGTASLRTAPGEGTTVGVELPLLADGDQALRVSPPG